MADYTDYWYQNITTSKANQYNYVPWDDEGEVSPPIFACWTPDDGSAVVWVTPNPFAPDPMIDFWRQMAAQSTAQGLRGLGGLGQDINYIVTNQATQQAYQNLLGQLNLTQAQRDAQQVAQAEWPTWEDLTRQEAAWEAHRLRQREMAAQVRRAEMDRRLQELNAERAREEAEARRREERGTITGRFRRWREWW